MNSKELQQRTKKLALDIVKLVSHLPDNRVGWTFSGQIIRSSSSVAANYRAVCRAGSDKAFVHKLNIVLEEADETLFWLEMIEESGIIAGDEIDLERLKIECNELISIFVTSLKTVKKRTGHS